MGLYNFELKRTLAIINSFLSFHKSVNGSIQKLIDFTKLTWLINMKTQIRTANPFALAAGLPGVNNEHIVPTDSTLARPSTDKNKSQWFL